MKKALNIIFFLLFLIIIPVLVYSQPPFETISISPDGVVISFPLLFFFEQGEDIIFDFHVFNSTTGLQLTNTTTNCTLHIFDNTGDHVINQEPVPFDSTGVDWVLNVSGTNFTRLGAYAFLVNCQAPWGGGFDNHRFRVTLDGEDDEVITNTNSFSFNFIFWIMFLLSIIFIVMMHKFKEDTASMSYGFFAMILMILMGSILLFGFQLITLDNLSLPYDLNRLIGIICIVIGLYSAWFSVELYRFRKREHNKDKEKEDFVAP